VRIAALGRGPHVGHPLSFREAVNDEAVEGVGVGHGDMEEGSVLKRMSTSIDVDPAMDSRGSAAPVRFDTNVAMLLRDDLAVWQQLNVAACTICGVRP
jgi:hypothetical protein